eukprot:10846715-Ditylum_brightwellii.AAC.1
MDTVDLSIYVKSEVTNEAWKTPNDIPSVAAFNNAFNIKQESVFKGGSKAKVYATLVTKMRFNTIKHHHDVGIFIKVRNVYIKPDRYNRNNVVSLGILIKVHPTIVWKKDLLKDIQHHLS